VLKQDKAGKVVDPKSKLYVRFHFFKAVMTFECDFTGSEFVLLDTLSKRKPSPFFFGVKSKMDAEIFRNSVSFLPEYTTS
jgi:hypothetical protein